LSTPNKRKFKRVYKLYDLTSEDISLLIAAANVPPEAMFCFGLAWYKLKALNLIDEDTKVTHDGIQAIKDFDEEANKTHRKLVKKSKLAH
jgi:hypothetical protein